MCVCVCVCAYVCVEGGSSRPTECLLESPPETNLPIPPTASPRPHPNLPRPNHTLGFLFDDMAVAFAAVAVNHSTSRIRFRDGGENLKQLDPGHRVPDARQHLSRVY